MRTYIKETYLNKKKPPRTNVRGADGGREGGGRRAVNKNEKIERKPWSKKSLLQTYEEGGRGGG